jgi:hypothetical protein
MNPDSAFIGVHISYGRKPFTLASIDEGLDVVQLSTADLQELGATLSERETVTVGVAQPSRSRRTPTLNNKKASALYTQLKTLSFAAHPTQDEARQWFKVNSEESFGALLQRKLFPKHSLQGRIQRALVLHDRGLRIDDPMEFFEEVTRYKLLQGILPSEHIYLSKELEALLAAYLAWMTVNRPQQLTSQGDFILPTQE